MQNSKTYRLLTRQYKGEPTLRYNHNNTYVSFIFKNKSSLSIAVNGLVYTDMIGTRTTYNTQTGAYAYMSDNVHSGNWTLNPYVVYSGKLDKKGLFGIETRLSLGYTKSTDFDIAYDADINNFL